MDSRIGHHALAPNRWCSVVTLDGVDAVLSNETLEELSYVLQRRTTVDDIQHEPAVRVANGQRFAALCVSYFHQPLKSTVHTSFGAFA